MNNGGNIPLGYYVDKATGRLAVNPETAPYVQELFPEIARTETSGVKSSAPHEQRRSMLNFVWHFSVHMEFKMVSYLFSEYVNYERVYNWKF